MLTVVSNEDLALIAAYIKEVSGIVLDTSKSYLVESRLSSVLKEAGLASYGELQRKARMDRSGKLKTQIIDAITTNETSFFRDQKPFDLLKHKLVPDVVERNGKSIRPPIKIWCAASSTGQEIYSVAITLKELLGDISKYNIRIVGTDICNSALEAASRGRYSKLEISRGMTVDYLKRHFTQEENSFKISDELRSITFFQRINLLESFTSMGRFDIIMCRNVAIYFSPEDRKSLFERLGNQLNPEGVLVIGSTENLVGVTDRYKRAIFNGISYYEKNI